MYRHTDVKVSSQSCNTEHKIQPELQQGTEDTARAIAGTEDSHSNSSGQKIQPELQQGTEDTAVAIAVDRRYSHSNSSGQKIQLGL